MTTEPSQQNLVPMMHQINFSFETNNTIEHLEDLAYDNLTTPDYVYEQGESLSDYTEYKVASWINKYYLYIICAIGIPGNIACIVTLTAMKPFLSYALYMLLLAITDVLSLAIKLIYLQMTANDFQIGNISCQLIFFTGTISQQYSNWILVTMTGERFIAIWFPFKVKKICTKRNAAIINIVMVVLFIVANWHFLLTFEEVPDPMLVWACKPKPKFMYFINFVWYWIDGTLYAFLPILLIAIFNGLIIYAVKRSSKSRLDLTNGSAGSKRLKDRAGQQKQLTVMLLTISIVFIILVLPNCLFFIVKEYWAWKDTMHGTAQYFLLYQTVFVLSDLNHAVNFYLYCLSGRRFREHFFKLVCFCRKEARTLEASVSCYATVDQRNHQSEETTFTNISPVSTPQHQVEETTFTNISPVSTPHHLLQPSNSNESTLTDIWENSGHI